MYSITIYLKNGDKVHTPDLTKEQVKIWMSKNKKATYQIFELVNNGMDYKEVPFNKI